MGIDQIDGQHKELVKMVNELHRAMKMKMGAKQAGQILTGLADYAVSHFKTEETLFEKCQYPDRNDHKRAHEDWVAKVVEFKQEFDGGRAAFPWS